MMLFFGHLDARRGWTKQLHLGARRNINTRMAATIGKDTGYDSIGDWPQVEALATYLDSLDKENALPNVIVYNSNPADNHAFATMIGNFQDGATPGRIQMGSAWWFLDQKNGIEAQLDALSDAGLLSTSSAWSPTHGRSCRCRDTNTSAVFSATCSARKWTAESCPVISS